MIKEIVMSLSVESLQEPLLIQIDGELTIYSVGRIRAEILAKLNLESDLHLDLSDVIEIDTAGLQLLVAIRNAMVCSGKSLLLCNPSDAVKDLSRRCNFELSFGMFMSTRGV